MLKQSAFPKFLTLFSLLVFGLLQLALKNSETMSDQHRRPRCFRLRISRLPERLRPQAKVIQKSQTSATTHSIKPKQQ
ncbi:hypothetical protein IWZ00DRAFT_519660 [Phyllosticta capitalensis]